MGKAVICQGDPTSHGGKVLEGLASATIFGKRIAARGHKVFCPLCKGTFPIAEGVPFHTFAGLGTAVEGMRTGCGATLIATQHSFTIDMESSSSLPHKAQGEADATNTSAATAAGLFDQHFVVVNKQGRALSNLPYTIRSQSGELTRGETTSEGLTARLQSNAPLQLSLTVLDEVTPIDPDWDR